jgi:hypothetical protein
MALLDRLRPQPGWKHADPAVRLAAVEALDGSDQAVLATIAREDDTARVRRAAVAKLQDIDTLAAVARGDSDAQIQADAVERLTQIASRAVATSDAEAAIPDGLLAVAAISSERHLAQIARSVAPIEVARAAADRLQDAKSFASVARHAEHETIRLAALGRLNDPAELEAVATHTEHKDVGLAALDRLCEMTAETATLDGIAVRAKNKVVARRARAIVKERATADAAARAAADTLARKRALLCDAVETLDRTLERTRDVARTTNELARLTEDWEKLPPADAEAGQRWERAMERVRMHVEDLAHQETQEAERRAAWADATARRRTLIDTVTSITEEPAADRLTALRAEWDALEASDAPEIAALEREFTRACDAVTARATARERATAAHQRLAALAAEVAALADTEDRDSVRARWQAATAEWRDLTHGLPIDAALHAQYSGAVSRWRERDAAARDAAARQASENQARLQELHDRATSLGASADAPMKDLDRLARDMRAAVESPGALPDGVADDLLPKLKVLHAALGNRLRELRETDEWRRWANAGIQEELCKRIEALKEVTDLAEVSRQLRDLRRQWKAVSAAPKDEADALWTRFKTAADEAQARADSHFATVAAEQAENLTKRQALVEQAEALAQSTDWIATAETLKKLQSDWQTIGAAPKEQAPELMRRFRVACDTFFTRRKTDLAQRKEEWSGNQKKKEELCVRMEQLAESTDWVNTFNEIKKLQAEWKTVGAVRRNKSEALWKRFRGACDKFFERYGKRHEIDLGKKLEEREAVCQTLEGMVPPPETAPSSDELVHQLEELWKRWRQAPGVPPQTLAPMRARFETAVTSVFAAYPEQFKGTIFDTQQTIRRMQQLCDDVENVTKGVVPTAQLGATSAAALATLLKEKLAANTIGGRVNEEAKARAAFERVRHAQQAWRDLGPVLGQEGHQLESRFHKAVRRFFEQHPQFEQAHRPHGGDRGDRGGRRPQHHGGRPSQGQGSGQS